MSRHLFWKDRRVLVTGHTGFKGSWLSLWLAHLGADVTGLALPPPTEPSLFVQAHVSTVLRSLECDVRDPVTLRNAFAQAQPEVVFHLAAQSLVKESYRDPITTFDTNVMGTVNVLEAVRHSSSVRAVVVVTSDKCYENDETGVAHRESDPMGGHDPYSSSKGCAELVVAAYRRSFFTQTSTGVASARAGNVIGGGDWAKDRLIPDAVRAFAHGQSVILRNPQSTRPWQHVLEPCSGYLLLAERLMAEGAPHSGGWNFGPAEAEGWPVAAVIERLAGFWGLDPGWEKDGAVHPHEAKTLSLDIGKAVKELKWQPRLTIDQALEWTARWYRAADEHGDLKDLTMADIKRFEQLT